MIKCAHTFVYLKHLTDAGTKKSIVSFIHNLHLYKLNLVSHGKDD